MDPNLSYPHFSTPHFPPFTVYCPGEPSAVCSVSMHGVWHVGQWGCRGVVEGASVDKVSFKALTSLLTGSNLTAFLGVIGCHGGSVCDEEKLPFVAW